MSLSFWPVLFISTCGCMIHLTGRDLRCGAGVSVAHDFDLNSLAVPRKAKEAIGGIARLTHRDGRSMTVNVEYNQLDPLLRATSHPDGDTNDSSGFSPFPGTFLRAQEQLGSR